MKWQPHHAAPAVTALPPPGSALAAAHTDSGSRHPVPTDAESTSVHTRIPASSVPQSRLFSQYLRMCGPVTTGMPVTVITVAAMPVTAMPITAIPVPAIPVTAIPVTAMPITVRSRPPRYYSWHLSELTSSAHRCTRSHRTAGPRLSLRCGAHRLGQTIRERHSRLLHTDATADRCSARPSAQVILVLRSPSAARTTVYTGGRPDHLLRSDYAATLVFNTQSMANTFVFDTQSMLHDEHQPRYYS